MRKVLSVIAVVLLLSLCVAGCSGDNPPAPTAPTYQATTAPTSEFTTAPTTEATAAPTTEPTTEPTAEPTTAPTTEPTAEPTTAATTEQSHAHSETMVWIPTNGGKKYHTYAGCSNMKNPEQVTQSEAEDLGFTPCKRCH